MYSVREDEGYIDVRVVLELTEPLPDEMVDLEVKTMDNTALGESLFCTACRW